MLLTRLSRVAVIRLVLKTALTVMHMIGTTYIYTHTYKIITLTVGI